MKTWYAGGPEADKFLVDKYKSTLIALGQGKLNHWLNDRDGCLAAILLCDQFSRGIFRKSPDAFKFDTIALH